MSSTSRSSSRVPCSDRSIAASDGSRPPGKMYVWIQLAPRTCGPHPLHGEIVLGARDRDRRDPAAELAGGVQREAAPARADLEDVLARAQARPLGHPPVLVALGVGQWLIG